MKWLLTLAGLDQRLHPRSFFDALTQSKLFCGTPQGFLQLLKPVKLEMASLFLSLILRMKGRSFSLQY